jgi:hypothetical protein
MVVPDAIAAVAHDQEKTLRAGEIDGKDLGRIAPMEHGRIGDFLAIDEDSKGNGTAFLRFVVLDFVVDPDDGLEAGRVAVEIDHQFTGGVGAEAVGINRAVQGERMIVDAVAGLHPAVALLGIFQIERIDPEGVGRCIGGVKLRRDILPRREGGSEDEKQAGERKTCRKEKAEMRIHIAMA